MRRLAKLLCIAITLCTLLAPASTAEAQRLSRTPRPAGAVTGLEIALDGALRVHRGAELRWFFTLYEVVGHDTLRLARNGRVRVLASFRPQEPVAELRTDANGRAEVAIPVTDTNVSSFEVVVEAESGGAARTFRTNVTVEQSGSVTLIADRSTAQPGERLTFIGRAWSFASAGPCGDQEVTLRLFDQDRRELAAPRELRTDAGGVFFTDLEVPDGVEQLQVRAHLPHVGNASASVNIARPTAPRTVLVAVPQDRIASPGSTVFVDVVLRRADGRPVPRATVSIDGGIDERVIRTDINGRARLRWRAPTRPSEEAARGVTTTVTARREGLGEATAEVTVRVVRAGRVVGVAVEGGAFIPGLPARLFLRVVENDGQPSRGVHIALESPLIGRHEGRTNENGALAIETRPETRAGIEGRDRCGGATASAVTLTIGEGDEAFELERCLPIDPDATVRVRTALPWHAAGDSVEVELRALGAVGRAPIELALLRRWGENLELVSRTLVNGGATRTEAVTIPENIYGELVLRARPLIGRAREPVRGGTTALLVSPGRPVGSQLEQNESSWSLRCAGPDCANADDLRATLLIVPESEGSALAANLRRNFIPLPTAARAFVNPTTTSGPLLAGWLASRSPRDDAAPAVLRGRRVVVMPAPEDPVEYGVLRDPIRTRARYIRGRLALVVRSLEARLAEAIPSRISDVGVRRNGRWQLNEEALEAILGAHLLTRRAPTTLGGDPLTIADLQELDRAITFDNIARRVTRERLLSLLIEVREFVRDQELDLWQEGNDPGPWLDVMIADGHINEVARLDAWGNPMAIRRAPGGRARFALLRPLPQGWELASAGPDGRFGTGDDVVDPFARVLQSGSPYAEAVGEDDLLARLRRIELSQATIEVVTNLFEVNNHGSESGASLTAARRWDDVPRPAEPLHQVTHFERAWLPIERSPAQVHELETQALFTPQLGDEPRSYGVVTLSWNRSGWADVAQGRTRAGCPVILSSREPGHIFIDREVILPVIVTQLPGSPEGLLFSAESDGQAQLELIDARGEQTQPITPGPGGSTTIRVRLRGAEVGDGSIRFTARAPSGDARRTIELPLAVRATGLLRVQNASAALAAATDLAIDLPRDASEARGRVVVSRPDAFRGDPALARWRDQDPALIAWAMSIAGQDIPSDLRRDLEAATNRDGTVTGQDPWLSAACATVAWAATTEGTHWAPRATAAATARARDERSDRRELAAMLAALSVAVGPSDDSPLSTAISSMRDTIRSAVRHHRDDRAMLARGAAALLLADRRDIRGQTMLALVRQHLVPGFHGGLVVDLSVEDEEADGDEEPTVEPLGRGGRDQLIATAALAIAAHQDGDDELARALARGAAARAHLASTLGGEPLFWLLAARAFGVFGIPANDQTVTVHVDQGESERELTLGEEALVLPLELPRPGRETSLRFTSSGGAEILPLVQVSARYIRPITATEGPLTTILEGDPGFADERAAFTVTVVNESAQNIELPQLLVTLPMGTELDSRARAAMMRNAAVAEVEEPDTRGVVRVHLNPLAADERVRLPLPLLWTSAGERLGPSVAAFPADRAWQLSISEPEELEIEFRP